MQPRRLFVGGRDKAIPMHILIQGINFSPELTGIGKYTGEMAEWLAGRGHEVRVVTAPPHYPVWRAFEGYSARRFSREKRILGDGATGGLDVYRCPVWIPRTPRGWRRILYLASFALSSALAMLPQIFWRPDVVMLVGPTLFCVPPALCVAWLSGALSWLHVQDFEVDAAFELEDLFSPRARRLAYTGERFLFRRFDRVSAISERMVERLAVKGVDDARAVLFPNWVDTSAIYPLPAPSPLRQSLGIPDHKIVALYSGNMGKKQGLDLLAEASQRLASRADIQLVLCGAGACRERLVRMTEGSGNVRFLPLQPAGQLNDLLNLADIHLLPQRASAADLMMPSKLTGMLASGRAIVATADATTHLATVLEGIGIVTPPGDVHAFVSAVIRLAEDGNLRQQLGREARKYAEGHLQRDEILRRFELSLLKACGHSRVTRTRLSSRRTGKGLATEHLPLAAKKADDN
jgi:colanic acid biosynthesis glycosyl transferase WcaI